MKIVLCIDDMPVRCKQLSKSLNAYDIAAVFTCRLEDFIQYMEGPHEIVGVCLDHDMPFQDGKWFAKQLREHNYPVCITSCNRGGAKEIEAILDEYETPNAIVPCDIGGWEKKVIRFFETWK